MAWFAHASNAVNVGRAVGEASGRSCTINITNGSRVYSLVNPKVWMISGYNTHPPPPTVGSKQKGVCAFSKTTGTATGAVGVLTYDLFIREKCRAEKMMAIMFSVPFDYTYYENWLAVGIFDLGQPCDHALYNLMYYKHDPRFVRARATDPSMLFTWGSVEIRASMSNACSAIAQVEIHDKCNSKMCY
ncbi:tereporin-Ca1-like [Chanos chanos]|uniref:Tereporin-Ca1-like n=1 Tax=Chanos chanos TaxID=29144 RepID=A0A6J2V445_CHACN|nr:tereporin-Ca1-like [Chanos chanos]